MEKFRSSIKRKYRERLINRQEQWPPCHGEKLISLELVKRNRGHSYADERVQHCPALRKPVKDHQYNQYNQRKEDEERIPIAYSDLFKPAVNGRKQIRRVLAEGDAGIGKTTLCTSISEDWANEKLFCEFNLLLLLPLREREVASAGSLPELLGLLHSSSSLRAVVADIIEEEEGENVLIVADGWDELISETKRQDETFLYKLLFGKLYPFVSVLMTSRPSASASLHKLPNIDRFVTVCGFNKQNIKEYIQLEFTDDKAKCESLLDQVESNPLIESICSIPLNCAIICHLWRTLEEALPVTMTELYTKIILNILLRNIRKSHPTLEGITSFDTLPGNLSKSWWLLCEFAFLALARDSIVFSQDELIHFYPQGLDLDKEILCFGLLQYSKPILDTGYGMSFHFLHLTFQEYLAALHFVKQPLNCQFESSMATKSRFSMVLRFSSGIFFKNIFVTYDIEAGIFIDILIHNCNTVISDDMTACLELCHCAFEADYQPLTEKVIQLIYPYIPKPQNAHDCAAMLYLLDSINSHNNLEIQLKNCTSSKLTARLAEVLANKHERVQVTELSISGGNLTENDICLLFRRAASALQSIKSLKLYDNEISTTTFIITSPLMLKQCPYNLCNLNLSRNPLGTSGIQCLEDAIRAGSLFSLNEMVIQQTLTSDQDINGALLTTLCDSLSIHCPHLNHFDVSHNKLGTPGAQAIGSALHHINKQEKGFSLVLSDTELRDEGVGAFVSYLHCSCCLNCLIMSSNHISDDGALHLLGRTSVSYNHNIMLWKLDLSNNPLGFERILSLITASNCSVGTLSLCKCWLTEYPMRDLPMTPQTNTIQFLNLDENQFCKENIQILAKTMNSCPNLEALSCCQCGITSDDLRYLLSQLSFSFIRQLQAWWLNDNEIDDSGISALIECLMSFSLSCSFGIDGNPVSSEMQEKFYTAEVSVPQDY